MKLSSLQVAEKLGITTGTVRDLRDKGDRVDVAVRKENAKKHYSYFDSKQVNEFAKTYRNRLSGRQKAPAQDTSASGAGAGAGLLSRLESIENKVDRLLRIWE